MNETESAIIDADEPLERTSLGPGRLGVFRDQVHGAIWLRGLLTVVLVVIVVASLLPAFLFYRRSHPSFAKTRLGNITLTVNGQGTVQPLVYSASFAIPGTVAVINVAPGQRVNAGDTLASLDSTQASAAVSDAQTAVNDAQSDVSATATTVTDAQTALSDAQTQLSDAQSALGDAQSSASTACGGTDDTACAAAQSAQSQAQTQVDAAQSAVDSAQVKVDAAQADQTRAQVGLDAAQSALNAAQTQEAATTLVAPHDGMILTVNGQAGDEVGMGGLPFITMTDLAEPLATALIGYQDILKVEPGETATVQVAQASKSLTFKGTVAGVTLSPRGSGSSLAYPVTVQIDPASLKGKGVTMLPGMATSVTIVTRQVTDAILVPVAAVTYARQAAPVSGKGLLTKQAINDAIAQATGLANDNLNGAVNTDDPPQPAYLIGFEHGKYVAIPVVLGLSDGRYQEVMDGLDVNQQVVVAQRNPFLS